jgi:hypothetical protein
MAALRTHLTYANLVATVALFLALATGGAYASSQLAPKSVGEKQLRPGAVTADKIRKNAVTAPKIAALAVKEGKIAAGAVSAAKLAGQAVTNEKLAANAVTNDKLADGSVTGAKVDEASLGQVPSARSAEAASFAESANPASFAAISQEGDVDPSLSKGISLANVKQGIEAGIYCITVPSFAPAGPRSPPTTTAPVRSTSSSRSVAPVHVPPPKSRSKPSTVAAESRSRFTSRFTGEAQS